MSRIGKKEIEIKDGIDITIEETPDGQRVTVKGPKGTLTRVCSPELIVSLEANLLKVTRKNESKRARERHGLMRTLLSNMVIGVSEGFTKNLEIVGVGYRAALKGSSLDFQLGKSHPVIIDPPEGIVFTVDGNTKLTVSGIDKEAVGQVAANIRFLRPPEPYKGKGVKYAGERIRRKAGKSGSKGG